MAFAEITPVSSPWTTDLSPEVSPDPSIRSKSRDNLLEGPVLYNKWDGSPPKGSTKRAMVHTGTSISPRQGLVSNGTEPSVADEFQFKTKRFISKQRTAIKTFFIVLISFSFVFFLWSYKHSSLPTGSKDSHLLQDNVSDSSSGRGLRSRVKLFDWNPQNEREVKRHRIKTLHIVFYDGTNADASVIEEAMAAVASQFYKHNILHVKVKKELMRDFQFFLPEDPETHVPFSTIVEVDRGFKKYRLPSSPGESLIIRSKDHYKAKLTSLTEQFSKFEDQYLTKSSALRPWLRTENPVARNEKDDSFVAQLVGSEFQTEVIKARNDALVFFYAPWCGHCKRFEKTFAELADSFQHVETVKFFKMDVTKNDIDHPGIVIHRVPYVRLFKMHDKANPVVFEHAHENLKSYGKQFLQENIVLDADLNEL
eukprot:GHVN01073816.1.p1 GENE.GHVN01073816.1~~GHVN01073816.1.p1  ORF type:complete len:424 (-),score=46.92 GHVN01073816.1:3096-4367(-)